MPDISSAGARFYEAFGFGVFMMAVQFTKYNEQGALSSGSSVAMAAIYYLIF